MTGEQIGEIPATPLDKCDELLYQARQPFTSWSQEPLKTRLGYFRSLRHLLIERLDESIDLIAKEPANQKQKRLPQKF